MILGLRTVIYGVKDVEKSKKWYEKVFGVSPYFDEPFYVGFNIGGYELGLDPNQEPLKNGTGSVAYWGVENIEKAVDHFVKSGAKLNTEIQNVGGDILVATLTDPDGNVMGLIQNPHFKLEK